MKKLHSKVLLKSVSFVALAIPAAPALAQQQAPAQSKIDAPDPGDIIVTARRKEELVQDVPKVINVVTGADLDKLNIRQFQDVQSTVPGLNLQDSGTGYTQKTTLRGVSFDVTAGADATVDFYLNDASIQQTYLFRTLYDIGSIEVLRGPQGTLRGRATPSGSIVVTTHQPDLYKLGGYVDGTVSSTPTGRVNSGTNLQGAINVPIIEGKLAVRIAGQVDDNDGMGIRAAHVPGQDALNALPYNRTWSQRVSVRFEPTDTLQFNVTYQHMAQHFLSYQQTASTCILAGTPCPDTNAFGQTMPVVRPEDRVSTNNGNTQFREIFDVVTGRADWHIFGQKLSYVGMYGVSTFDSYSPLDLGDVYSLVGVQGASNAVQLTHSRNRYQSHEVRLASEESIAGIFDYTVGIFTINTPTQNTIVFDPARVLATSVLSPLSGVTSPNEGTRRETSVFGNLTAHVTDKLEISGGIRKIIASGNTSATSGIPATSPRWLPTIWTASASYHITPTIMAYLSAGTSSRQGTTSVGPILTAYGQGFFPQAAIQQFANLQAEYSHSYEVGVKTQFNDRHGLFNLTYFHQDFSNFQYANSSQIKLKNPANVSPRNPDGSVLLQGFGANVPVKVDGVEGELGYRFSPNFNIDVTASYVKSRITGGTVACNAGTLLTDSAGNSISTCAAGGPASFSPPFTATVRSEYDRELSDDMIGYLRGQLAIYGATQYNPDVPLNKQDSYVLLNAYLGVRDPNNNWDLSFFVKNLTNTKTVLQSATGNTQAIGTGLPFAQPYTMIAYTPPRQIGLNLRVAFGSH